MSYYLGARDIFDIVKYVAERSKDLKEFMRKLDIIERALRERRIHQLREQLYLYGI